MNKDQLINLLKSNSFWAKKNLGQNFLVDDNALGKIIQAAELKNGDFVLEVGPGFGVLTEELVKTADDVVAIEMDSDLVKFLDQKFDTSNKISRLKVINSDILSVNIPELIKDRHYKVVANIPYYITSKIIRLFLEQKNKPESIILLVQKEVAERICADAGDMSVLSLSVQYYAIPQIVDIVPKESFFPAPQVDSAILKITIKDTNFDSDYAKEFFRLVNIGFSSRRKTLSNNLSSGFKIDKNKATDIIKSMKLNESVRAQELSIDNWKDLLKKLK